MDIGVESGDVISALLLVKAVLAVLAVLLFVYYKLYWEKAKRHLPIHFFYAKWRAVRHAVALGARDAGPDKDGYSVLTIATYGGSARGQTLTTRRYNATTWQTSRYFFLCVAL